MPALNHDRPSIARGMRERRAIAAEHPFRGTWWDDRNLLPLLDRVEVLVYLGCDWQNVPLHLPHTFMAYRQRRREASLTAASTVLRLSAGISTISCPARRGYRANVSSRVARRTAPDRATIGELNFGRYAPFFS
jgi:hypothetical protein